MDLRWILTFVQGAVCSAPGSKVCTSRWPMPVSVNSTAPPVPSIFSPNTTAAGEDGIHRRGRHSKRQPSWLPVTSPDFAAAGEDGIHRNGRHPERQPSRLPIASPDFAAVLEDGIQKNGWHPQGVPFSSPAPPAHRRGAFCSVCGHRSQTGCPCVAG
jgi:hypothetical protein